MLSTTDPTLAKVKSAQPGDVSLPPSARPPLNAARFDVSLSQALLGSAKSPRARTVPDRLPEVKPDRRAPSGLIHRNRPASTSADPRPAAPLKKPHPRPLFPQAKRAREKDSASESRVRNPEEHRARIDQAVSSPEAMQTIAPAASVRRDADPSPAMAPDASSSDSAALAAVVIPFPFADPRRGIESEPGAVEGTDAPSAEGEGASTVIVPLFAGFPGADARGLISGTDLAGHLPAATDESKIIPLPLPSTEPRVAEAALEAPERSGTEAIRPPWIATD